MNELVTDIKSLELETLKNLKSSKASNTLRAYKSDYRDFINFCIKHGFKSMPSEPKVLSLYLTHLSQKKVEQAQKDGKFEKEIVPIQLNSKKFFTDEHPRSGITPEKLARLKSAFKKKGTVTAGNSSGINDGAAAVVLMSQKEAKKRRT